MEKASPPPPTELLPPPDPARALRLGLASVGLSGLAAGVGFAADLATDGGPSLVSSARLVLVAAGGLLAGVALSMRPDRWPVWLAAAGTAALAALAGLPRHWDSAVLLAGTILLPVCGWGAVLTAAGGTWRRAGLTACVLFHFAAILGAVTWPQPTPWITQQGMVRLFSPYLTAVYLRNAYHFYSPEPGPASLLHVLVRYEFDDPDPATGKPRLDSAWVVLPQRREHWKDPFGLSYYRRLSLTEAASQTLPDAQTADTFNRNEATQARAAAAMNGYARIGPDGKAEQVVVPLPPAEFEPPAFQYRVPDPLVVRNLLPSYARHLAATLTRPGAKVVNVRVYRLEHRVVPPEQFVGVPGRYPRLDPFHPTTYRPYFLGDYDPDGTLVNPRDPLLYWLIPVLPKPGGAAPTDKDGKDFDDYLSRHAGAEVEWRRP